MIAKAFVQLLQPFCNNLTFQLWGRETKDMVLYTEYRIFYINKIFFNYSGGAILKDTGRNSKHFPPIVRKILRLWYLLNRSFKNEKYYSLRCLYKCKSTTATFYLARRDLHFHRRSNRNHGNTEHNNKTLPYWGQ